MYLSRTFILNLTFWIYWSSHVTITSNVFHHCFLFTYCIICKEPSIYAKTSWQLLRESISYFFIRFFDFYCKLIARMRCFQKLFRGLPGPANLSLSQHPTNLEESCFRPDSFTNLSNIHHKKILKWKSSLSNSCYFTARYFLSTRVKKVPWCSAIYYAGFYWKIIERQVNNYCQHFRLNGEVNHFEEPQSDAQEFPISHAQSCLLRLENNLSHSNDLRKLIELVRLL